MAQRKRNVQKPQNSNRKDYMGIKFLGVMFLLVVIVCGGFLVFSKIRARVSQPANTQSALETVRVTFPEGRTVMQCGKLLEQNEVCTAEEFYAAMRDNDFTADYTFLPSNDVLQQREYPLEGYLYPDTYDFFVGEDAVSVIKRFLNNFDTKVADELIEYANSNGEGFKNIEMSFDKAVNLASIVGNTVCSNIGSLAGLLLISQMSVSVYTPISSALGILSGFIASLCFREKVGILSYLAALGAFVAIII